jgi:hypothetical protein
VAIAWLLYERGVEDFAGSERDSALALVALYKSLGGGWQAASTQAYSEPLKQK